MSDRVQAHLGLNVKEFNDGLANAAGGLNRFAAKANDAGGSIKSWASGIPVIGKITTAVFAAIAAVQSLGAALSRALSLAIEREELTATFTAFYGSADMAKKKIEEFDDYADSARFEFKDVATAGRRLDVLTQGAFAGKEALAMIGDAAKGTGANFADLGTNLGLLYAKMSEGDPIAGPLKSLQKLGIVAPDSAAKIRDMAEAGEPLEAMWSIVTRELERFKGTTSNMANTFSGSVNAMQESWNDILLAMATPVLDVLSPYIIQASKGLADMKDGFSGFAAVIKLTLNVAGAFWLAFKTAANLASLPVLGVIKLVQNLGEMLQAVWRRDFEGAKSIARRHMDDLVQIYKDGGKRIADDAETWAKSVVGPAQKIAESNPKKDNGGGGVVDDAEGDATIKKEEKLADLRSKNAKKLLSDQQQLLEIEKQISANKAEQAHYELIAAGASDANTKKKFSGKATDAAIRGEELLAEKNGLVKKQEDERLKLVEAIGKAKEEIALEEMTTEEKLVALQAAAREANQRAAIATGNESLEFKKQELELTKKIAETEKALAAEKKQIQEAEKSVLKAKENQTTAERDRTHSSLGDLAKQTSGRTGRRAREIQQLEERARKRTQMAEENDQAGNTPGADNLRKKANDDLARADALRKKTAGLKDTDRDPLKAHKEALKESETRLAEIKDLLSKPQTATVNKDGTVTVTPGS